MWLLNWSLSVRPGRYPLVPIFCVLIVTLAVIYAVAVTL